MDITIEQHQVTIAITAVEDRLTKLNARLAQQVEELTDTHAQVRIALGELDDLREAHRREGYAIEAIGAAQQDRPA